jgi:hypothetical protein
MYQSVFFLALMKARLSSMVPAVTLPRSLVPQYPPDDDPSEENRIISFESSQIVKTNSHGLGHKTASV